MIMRTWMKYLGRSSLGKLWILPGFKRDSFLYVISWSQLCQISFRSTWGATEYSAILDGMSGWGGIRGALLWLAGVPVYLGWVIYVTSCFLGDFFVVYPCSLSPGQIFCFLFSFYRHYKGGFFHKLFYGCSFGSQMFHILDGDIN